MFILKKATRFDKYQLYSAGDERSINSVKPGIIIASLIAGVVGYAILRLTSKENSDNEMSE
jgi:Na+/H+ antiporter NhaA